MRVDSRYVSLHRPSLMDDRLALLFSISMLKDDRVKDIKNKSAFVLDDDDFAERLG